MFSFWIFIPIREIINLSTKPVLHIKHEEIKELILQRIVSINLNKFFDIKIIYKNSNIVQKRINQMTQYFSTKKIAVRKLEEKLPRFQVNDSDEDDCLDHKLIQFIYLKQLNQIRPKQFKLR